MHGISAACHILIGCDIRQDSCVYLAVNTISESGSVMKKRDFAVINNGIVSLFLRFAGIYILTADKICREYRASRSRKAAYFLMRLCAVSTPKEL